MNGTGFPIYFLPEASALKERLFSGHHVTTKAEECNRIFRYGSSIRCNECTSMFQFIFIHSSSSRAASVKPITKISFNLLSKRYLITLISPFLTTFKPSAVFPSSLIASQFHTNIKTLVFVLDNCKFKKATDLTL